ncbi:hypothetical protein BTA51_14915 [Hahella sp. CCB-MM4]|nr:hypothetical protein BTA51_14915 [Hahella sp. CCB-MM4]
MHLVLFALLLLPVQSSATKIEFVNFLIPSGEGGGWDTTAREAGDALLASNLIKKVNYENLVGAGGGRAIIDIVEHPDRHTDTLMVQSTPLLLRRLTGTIKYGFRDITPVSIMITEYQAVAVPFDSKYQSINELVDSIRMSPAKHPIIGGSSYGSLDHISIELIAKAADLPSGSIRYIASDGGGEAMHLLEQGYGTALVSGIGEMLDAYQAGKIRILGVTSPARLPELPEVKTFIEQGIDVEFANWRGFFASPTISRKKLVHWRWMLEQLNDTETWHDVRRQHFWSEKFLHGDEMIKFLEQQEKQLKIALDQLKL